MSNPLIEAMLHIGSYASPQHPKIGFLFITIVFITMYIIYLRYRGVIKQKIRR